VHLREREAAATQYEVTYVLKGKTPMNLKRMVGVGSRLLLKLLSHDLDLIMHQPPSTPAPVRPSQPSGTRLQRLAAQLDCTIAITSTGTIAIPSTVSTIVF